MVQQASPSPTQLTSLLCAMFQGRCLERAKNGNDYNIDDWKMNAMDDDTEEIDAGLMLKCFPFPFIAINWDEGMK